MTAVDNGQTPATEIDSAERDRLLSQAYGAAQSRLREENKDRFNALYSEEAKKRGIIWTPRKSKEEAALDTILELLAAHPKLAESLASKLSSAD